MQGLSLNCPLILASTSPRRIELLRQVGLQCVVISPNTEEKRLPRESPARMVARLSRRKAESVAREALSLSAGALIIAADTIVVAPDGKTVLGKPRTEDVARRMVALLAGKTHTVLTGYCLLGASRGETSKVVLRVVRSRVRMRSLSKAEIRAYVATGEPMDKAGAYAAQGIGAALIERISGSYTNVVGLPMAQLLADLDRRFGVSVLGGADVRRT